MEVRLLAAIEASDSNPNINKNNPHNRITIVQKLKSGQDVPKIVFYAMNISSI